MGMVCDTVQSINPGTNIAGSTTDFVNGGFKVSANAKRCRLTISFDTSGTLSLRVNSTNLTLATLTAHTIADIAFNADPSQTLNFRHSVGGNVEYFILTQSYE